MSQYIHFLSYIILAYHPFHILNIDSNLKKKKKKVNMACRIMIKVKIILFYYVKINVEIIFAQGQEVQL